MEQGMFSILLEPARFQLPEFAEEVRRFIDFVKSSEKTSPTAEILVPGDVERRNRAERLAKGIELDENTWKQLATTAETVGVPVGGGWDP